MLQFLLEISLFQITIIVFLLPFIFRLIRALRISIVYYIEYIAKYLMSNLKYKKH